jgi:rSAM/selenodomain-associated transferase 1
LKESLILMFKSPEAGRVKTRLARDLSQEATLAVYRSMVNDVLEVLKAWVAGSNDRELLFWGDGDSSLWSDLGIFNARRQLGDSLGDRMYLAMADAFSRGANRVGIVGCDTPDLRMKDLIEAFDQLGGGVDSCFGPCEDGGYYLMTCRALPATAFVGIPWSEDCTLESLMRRLQGFGQDVSCVGVKRDVDTLADLKALNYRPDLWS